MKEESRKYVQEAYDIVTYAAKKSAADCPAQRVKRSMPTIWVISFAKSA